MKSRRWFKTNGNVVLTNDDKGNVVVPMFSAEYVIKLNNLLSDESAYFKLNNSPIAISHRNCISTCKK